ncbi:PREDICTED: uncharacterized protein LOC106894983 [Calidris pugnax]|uniref:uncharacterized protein LOC106894983 n=1 Tax=Calidris pugnax TaxID=198806 RepID=UPI00071D4C7E|nr:PREDICTED: uncharacterized protein LOC106894983 [Calidris pugnax]
MHNLVPLVVVVCDARREAEPSCNNPGLVQGQPRATHDLTQRHPPCNAQPRATPGLVLHPASCDTPPSRRTCKRRRWEGAGRRWPRATTASCNTVPCATAARLHHPHPPHPNPALEHHEEDVQERQTRWPRATALVQREGPRATDSMRRGASCAHGGASCWGLVRWTHATRGLVHHGASCDGLVHYRGLVQGTGVTDSRNMGPRAPQGPRLGSPTALADPETERRLRGAAQRGGHTLYVPRGALWGCEDIRRMDQAGTLASLKVTMTKAPQSFRLEGWLQERLVAAVASGGRVVLYEGPLRPLCPLAPNNVNTMAAAAVAAPSLGFDGVQACLVADPSVPDWHIVEVEVTSKEEDGRALKVTSTRRNPAPRGAVTGRATRHTFWSSLRAPGSRVPPETGATSGCPPPSGLYHERQRLELCALHALNNLLQRPCFTRQAANDICKRLAPDARLNPHRSLLGTGNYDVNVIMAALQGLGLAAVWWDKRRSLERLALGEILGFILNVPSNISLGFLELPFHRQHWLAVRQLHGTYFNLDSKLPAPVAIGGEEELRTFLRDVLSRGLCEVFLVVPRAVEESGAWLSPE